MRKRIKQQRRCNEREHGAEQRAECSRAPPLRWSIFNGRRLSCSWTPSLCHATCENVRLCRDICSQPQACPPFGKEIFCFSASSIHLTCAKSYIFKVKSVQIITLSHLPWVGTTHELLINNVIFFLCFLHQKFKTINKNERNSTRLSSKIFTTFWNIIEYFFTETKKNRCLLQL